MNFSFTKIKPYLLIIIGFISIAYLFTPKVLTGEIVDQADISSWRGMANEIIQHNENNPDDRALWTGSMFSGMPSTTISVIYDGDFTKPIYDFLFTGARPASYLLISLVGGFLMFLAFGTNVYLAAVGAIAITFCSYNMQIIQVGHNSKMEAIAFMPWVIAGVVYAYNYKALIGALLFALALGFQIKTNHPQITYYLAIIIIGYSIAEFFIALKNKTLSKFFKSSLLLLLFGLIGIATNANKLIPTFEYAEYTMRGGSELSSDSDIQTGDGLKLDYATQWSYGIAETPNLLIPNFNGGSSSGALSEKSETYKALKGKYQGAEQIIKQLPLYWGPQPFTAGPMYLGALTIFLFVLGVALLRGPYKWWIIGVSLIALFLGWGSHFMWFSKLFFNYAPLYNKFRTVSMTLVILQLTIPILGILAVKQILSGEIEINKVKKSFLIAIGATAGFAALFALIPSLAGGFTSPADSSFPAELAKALVEDRKALLRMDALRSIFFIIIGAVALWLAYTKKMKTIFAIACVGLLILVDLWGVGKRYLNETHFVKDREFQSQFTKRPVDEIILEDNDPHYRVLDLSVSTFQDSHTSFHHKTIGGYSPAKLQRYQDLIDFFISPEIARLSNNINSAIEAGANSIPQIESSLENYPILSMLNSKYIIISGDNPPIRYKNTLGNAWFVNSVNFVNNADEEIASLGGIDPSSTAIISKNNLSESNLESLKRLNNEVGISNTIEEIGLTHYSPNKISYSYKATNEALALFSEIYYPAGWIAKINGEEVDILRANYVLRALILPAGEGEIEFIFDPISFKNGKLISLISSTILVLSLLLLIAYYFRARSKNDIVEIRD